MTTHRDLAEQAMQPLTTALRPGTLLEQRKPGANVDRIDIAAGMAMLRKLLVGDPRTYMVIEYALQRWARGEEAAAERGATDASFFGIGFEQWRMVLSAARAAGEAGVRS